MNNDGLSYVGGSVRPPLMDITIGAMLEQVADRWPERDAFVIRHQGVRWTYREVNQKTDEVAAGLLAIGLRPGDRIGIWSQNCAEWILLQFATAKAGLILVTLNPAYRCQELQHATNLAGCSALIVSPAMKSSNYIDMLRELAPELDHCEPGKLEASALPSLRTVIRLGADRTPGMLNFSDLTEYASGPALGLLREIATTLKPDDPINIQFTSGTTGRPKGATLTHKGIINNGYFIGERMRFTERDRLCIPLPLYHCFALVDGVIACVTHGAASIFPGEHFDAPSTLAAIETEKCTAVHGVPTMFIALLNEQKKLGLDLSSLRTGGMGGSPCPIAVMRDVIEQMHLEEITIVYGMTETSPVSFQSSVDDPIERRVSTVGTVLPHVEAKIVDEMGRTVPRGTSGELLVRGYLVMAGYWNDPGKTRDAVDEEGWMHTGDLATLDEHGYCKIVGRLKDMVIRGGENIYPREVEELIYQHPDVMDVQVVGVPDQKYGEELCAWIKLRPASAAREDDIRSYCQGRISYFKVPRYILLVDDFPMTVTGKVQKYVMREQSIARLGLR
jgi:fatty-acyl-CoA synthase